MKILIMLFTLLSTLPVWSQDYTCMNQAKEIGETLMKANRESFKKKNSTINYRKKLSSQNSNVFQIVGINNQGNPSTIAYQLTMSLSGCTVTKFELIGAE